jgi:molybdenum cofactor biosynthesis enzyme MoaA
MNERMMEFFNSNQILTLWGPRIVEIVLTNICNSRCLMCDRYHWVKADRERRREMTLEKLLDLFTELGQMNVKRVPLSGGEPLMRKDFPEIVRGISTNGMDVTVVNNGTYMTPVNAQALAGRGPL